MEKRIAGLISQLDAKHLDALLLTNQANIRYMTGFTGWDSFALVGRNVRAFITDSRYMEWAKRECKGFDIIPYRSRGRKLNDVLAETCRRYEVAELGFEESFLTVESYNSILEKLGNIRFSGTQGFVERLRAVKDEQEILRIKKACEIMDWAFQKLLEDIKPGITEKDLNLKLELYVKQSEAEDISFPFIVAAGTRGSMPHSIPSLKKIEDGELITFDVGAKYQGYCSDMTRTVGVGHVDRRQAEAYAAVLAANEQAEATLRPGAERRTPCRKALETICERGFEDGAFDYPVGHGVGLEIHEEPFLRENSTEPLRAGNVVTIEPGVYLPDWGGIRVEDTLVITPDGAEPITRSNKELIIL